MWLMGGRRGLSGAKLPYISDPYCGFQWDRSPTGMPLVIEDMPHMAQFVYDFYREKLHQLMSTQGVSELVG